MQLAAGDIASQDAQVSALHAFAFGDVELHIAGEAGLYWREHRLLVVSDLHLEKASSYAVRGQMLPPYDSLATLEAVAALAEQCGAKAVLCLGDNYHDDAGEARLQGDAARLLSRLTMDYDWTWVVGNHDPEVGAIWGGAVVQEVEIDAILFRHEIDPAYCGPEISGHFHPKLRMNVRGRSIRRRAFVQSANRLIMPAFGTFTGGMDADDPAILAALDEQDAYALVPLKDRLGRFALAAPTCAK